MRRTILTLTSAAVLALPVTALAQANRTWVSGTGSDANPCSRMAPCLTWAGALPKTASGGEIDALDSGGFGAVTITKPITLSATGVTAGVLAAGTNGIVINTAGDTAPGDPDRDVVTLRGLDFNGLGLASPNAGLNGVLIQHAGTVRLEDDEIYGFKLNGVVFQPTAPTESGAPTPSLYIDNSTIHDNQQDAVLAVGPLSAKLDVFVTNSTFENNGCGLVASTLGVAAFTTTNCGAGSSGTPSATVKLSSSNTSVTGAAGAGILSAGTNATNFLITDVISGNGLGLSAVAGGSIVEVGTNSVFANGTDGSPTSRQSNAVAGPPGPAGTNGTNGTNGQVELVTCKQVTVTVKRKVHGKIRKVKVKKQKCTGKLVSGPVKFTITGKVVHATFTRNHRVVASGKMVAAPTRSEGLLAVSRRMSAGTYTLTTSDGRRVLNRRQVRVG
jgi:hypothetical protein